MPIPKTALVTGAGRRLGRSIALDLARAGYAVAIHVNRSRADGEAVAADIVTRGGRAAVVTGDLADAGRLEGIVAEAVAAIGPLGVLVNNASVFEDDRWPDVARAAFDRHMAVNLAAPLFLAQAFARALPKDAEGLVVNLIDQRVWKLTPQFASYTLSKAALHAATTTLAQALAPRIRVVGVAPGPTLPNPMEGGEGFATEVAGTLLRRGPELAEFGRAILFVADTPSITGQMIALDGGQHLAWKTPDVVG